MSQITTIINHYDSPNPMKAQILITLKGYYSNRNSQPFYLWVKSMQKDEPNTSLADLVARIIASNVRQDINPKWLFV